MRKNKKTDVFKFITMSTPDQCWPWSGAVSSKQRPYFTVEGKKYLAYRLVYELVHGSIPDDKMIRHTCDNSICCNPNHHVLGDHQENMNDMKARERHGQSKHVVNAIRKLASQGRPHALIAELYGIGRSTVTEIVNMTNYKEE